MLCISNGSNDTRSSLAWGREAKEPRTILDVWESGFSQSGYSTPDNFFFFTKNAPCEDNTEIIHGCTKLKTDCKKNKLIKNLNKNKLEKGVLKIFPLIGKNFEAPDLT